MAQTSLAKPTWTQRLYAAFDMFEMDDKQGCITILQAIVSEPGVPRYWRIQALVALATAVDDWYDAEEFQQEAEVLYRSMRILFPRGCDTDMDTLLARSRVLLDHLALELDDAMPDSIRALREQEEGEEEHEMDGEELDTDDDDDDDDEDDDDSENESAGESHVTDGSKQVEEDGAGP